MRRASLLFKSTSQRRSRGIAGIGPARAVVYALDTTTGRGFCRLMPRTPEYSSHRFRAVRDALHGPGRGGTLWKQPRRARAAPPQGTVNHITHQQQQRRASRCARRGVRPRRRAARGAASAQPSRASTRPRRRRGGPRRARPRRTAVAEHDTPASNAAPASDPRPAAHAMAVSAAAPPAKAGRGPLGPPSQRHRDRSARRRPPGPPAAAATLSAAPRWPRHAPGLARAKERRVAAAGAPARANLFVGASARHRKLPR